MITVVHPEDETTAFLKPLYDGQDYNLIDGSMTNREVRHALNHTGGTLMLLGHGTRDGLFSRKIDGAPFDRIIINSQHLYYLRRCHNLIGIWCHADEFAEQHRLTGLFSGMFISEMSEAYSNGVETTEEELATELPKFVTRLRTLLDNNVRLSEIPARIKAMDDARTQLTQFNYNSVYFMCSGVRLVNQL